jgi:hypothetical protein
MYARAVDQAEAHLRDLRHEEWGTFGLAAFALGLALLATRAHAELALPLFAGGVWSGVLGIRALWRRWDLVDRLSWERDAYEIPEVLAYASREATMERRRTFSALIRGVVAEPGPAVETRVRAVAQDLHALASELDDERLALDPAAAVACMRLLRDFTVSPLLNPELPPEDLRSRVNRIRSGFITARQARGNLPTAGPPLRPRRASTSGRGVR